MLSIAYAADNRIDPARYELFEHRLEQHFDLLIADRAKGFGMRIVKMPIDAERHGEIVAIALQSDIKIEIIQPV